VLDLFAGTGAFGIEALSRHARSAVFVDNYRASEKIILRNLNMCRLTQRSRVIRWDIRRGFDGSRLPLREFDLVFMDPPYGRGLVRIGLVNLGHAPILAAGHRVVIEHSVHEPLALDLQGYALHDQRRYGKTLVSFLECVL
jgi:16S rRNA (guanine966-N2)-methyltransferase